MRVAFLTNIVSPYRLPVFKRLANTPGWDFHVLTNATNEFDRSWEVDTEGVDVRQSKTWSIKRTVRSTEPVPFEQKITLHLPRSLWADLRKLRPDVVISHELGPRTMLASAYCRMHGIPLVIWAYQSRVSATQSGWLKDMIRRRLLAQANAVVGMGSQAREVLRGLGVADDRIVDAANAADHATLGRKLGDMETHRETLRIRERFGKGRRLACVYGRLVPLKGTDAMLRHWRALPKSIKSQWRLVFVGGGPLSSLIEQANDPSVVHAGQAAPDQMAAWYRAASLHVFPTLGDVWGLVVNEAMRCGVPTLCSQHAGCSDDLVNDGVDGFVYDPTSDDASLKLEQALSSNELETMGQRARIAIEPFTLDRLAGAFRQAVAQAAD